MYEEKARQEVRDRSDWEHYITFLRAKYLVDRGRVDGREES